MEVCDAAIVVCGVGRLWESVRCCCQAKIIPYLVYTQLEGVASAPTDASCKDGRGNHRKRNKEVCQLHIEIRMEYSLQTLLLRIALLVSRI